MSLEVSHLSKFYGNQKALDEVSFSATPGRILGFLGPNGAGKSTTMKIITGYLSADAGQVKILGENALENPKLVSPKIGYLPENNPLYLDLYVREFLEFSGGLYGMRSSHIRSRVEELVRKTGLSTEQHKKIGQLSKGYRQRVGLARALIHDPQVVILDEPTTGLDPNQLVEIRNLICEIAKDKTLIFSTHIMQEVEAICHDVVIINKGRILAASPLSELKAGSGQVELILETEEELELMWFEKLGKVKFGSKGNQQLVIETADPGETRKVLMQLIAERGLNLNSLNQSKKNLETLFREITQNL
ncbi:gliding motility-associated ABC transporter ATP-binding subunit GldA [Algoriphagus sp.]|uniref:gliding motility-associated ABC transporter ATP-binding subunit GldA n=1 Tax=Algoriphagus sp. TaxID=1872435 RepID=UPI00271B5FB4|nr:gliding motility-associated ABC transporter ATP-binding subunit GldA [Algoriphagus sp.]MDO8965528.1 gliding motility-associated ABC transporter ATP-binding subunit GldA [Algoriphagus sp.]MDP3201568.1 gliding motility-associated ABC transporter ATP-binding subunit GldA [Algoriphagus sp.]